MDDDQIPKIGEDVTALMPALGDDVTTLMSSHGPSPARPVATGGGRGTGLDVRKSNAWARDNAPAIGATLATIAGPAGFLPAMGMAAMGGSGGALLRGDEPGAAVTEGVKQAALEGGGRAVIGAGGLVARGLMKGTVPKNIAKDFDQVDIPQEMIERGVVPGMPASARRVSRMSEAANVERDAAAATVPNMPRRKIIEGLRPIYAEGVTGREPKITQAALEQMRTSARDIGPEGLSGTQAITRKDIKQRMADAAINNPDTAAFAPQLANAERGAIVSHLRETPRMGRALDESQTLMAIDKVMKDAALSNPMTRARIGGLTAASMSPVGLGATAHAVNQGSKLADPQLIRALMLLLSERSGQE